MHGDRDCQYNLFSMFYKEKIGNVSKEEAYQNLRLAKEQNHALAINVCKELGL